MAQNIIFPKYELNKSCLKFNVVWKKCKLDLPTMKIEDLRSGSDLPPPPWNALRQSKSRTFNCVFWIKSLVGLWGPPSTHRMSKKLDPFRVKEPGAWTAHGRSIFENSRTKHITYGSFIELPIFRKILCLKRKRKKNFRYCSHLPENFYIIVTISIKRKLKSKKLLG